MVRAKFRCDSITRQMSSRYSDITKTSTPVEIHSIKMSPVYSSDPNHENKKFWDASPGGSFEINCVNAEAAKQLELGKEYYFDISPAPVAA